MSELESWLIVGATVLVAAGAIFGEYAWRRLTGRWPPREGDAGTAGTTSIIVANTPRDDKDGDGDAGNGGGE